ncbi:MAG: S8 family serine peptidase [Candidatus Cloacimonetes bacterium]|nr:S8 family serine peptidase [Candidatus Cloacimonadota bacterium]
MKKNVFFILFIIISLHQTASTYEVRKDSSGRDLYASDRIKTKLNIESSRIINTLLGNNERIDQTGLETLDALNNEFGVVKIILAHRPINDKVWEQQTGFDRWYLIFVPEGTDIEYAVRQYKNNEYVETAIPEYLAYLTETPNDPYFDDCWGHDNTVSNGPGSGHIVGFDSHIEEAWDDEQGFGDPNVIIAILDTGTDYDHEDLDDNCIQGYDYGDNDSNPMDDSSDEGHGTCCGGVAAGEINNSIGIAGVAGGCSIMPLKIADSSGTMSFTSIDNAITHCGDNNVDIGSMSFGADISQGDPPSTDTAVSYAYSHGVTLLAATANNDYSHIHYPANHEYVIAVGAASPCGERKRASSCDGENWWGSNYGVNIQDAPDAVDIVAPTILPATDVTGSSGYSTGQYITNFNGTSCATPYAAGVAALIKSKNPLLTPAQVRTALTSTATDIIDEGPAGWDRYTGYGMVNADAAVGSVTGSGFPSCNITNPANGGVIVTGDIITITVDASDLSRSVSNVKIYIDDVLETTDYSAPYEFVWNTISETIDYHELKATAVDNDLNETDDVITVRIAHPTVNIFEDDFDSGGITWDSDNGTDLWYNVDPTSPSDDHTGGGNCFLTNGNTDYVATATYILTSPAIDLSQTNNNTLSFWMWLKAESDYDGGFIELYDGTNWIADVNSLLSQNYDGDLSTSYSNPYGGSLAWSYDRSSWTLVTVDLSTYSNQDFKFRYKFGSDSTIFEQGWAIDDVVVFGEITAIPGQGSGNNLGDPTLPVNVNVAPINIAGSIVNPDVIIDPAGDVGITVNIVVTDQVQSSTSVPNPDAVVISYAVDIVGPIDGVDLDFDLEFSGLSTNLTQIDWLNGTTWEIPGNLDWSTSDHVTFTIALNGRDGSTEIILGEDNPLPVTLSSFSAIYENESPTVNWITQSETNNAGWNIYRSLSSNFGQAYELNISLIPGQGTTSETSYYTYIDEYEYTNGFTYWYWLESVSTNGESESFGPITLTIPLDEDNTPEIPLISELYQNFPNPFNPSTNIALDIKEDEIGIVSIYNIKGQLIVSKEFEAGSHNFTWNAAEQSSGIYLYKLQTQNYIKIRKMLLLK